MQAKTYNNHRNIKHGNKKIKNQKYKKAELSSSFNLVKENFFKDVLKMLRLGDFFILAGKEFHKIQLVYWKVLRP